MFYTYSVHWLKTMFGSSLPAVVCSRAHVYYVLACVCPLWFPTRFVLCFCFVSLHLVSCVWWCPTHMCSVSLECPFLIAPSVFSNFYLGLLILFNLYSAFISRYYIHILCHFCVNIFY
jgi:hypothetical protein